MDRRTFLKAGAVAMVATPEAMRADLSGADGLKRRHVRRLDTRLSDALKGNAGYANSAPIEVFQANVPPDQLWVLERVIIYDQSTNLGPTANNTTTITPWITVLECDQGSIQNPTSFSGNFANTIFRAAWKIDQETVATNFTGGWNPPGKAGFDLSPPEILAAGQSYTFTLQDAAQQTFFRVNVCLRLTGWIYPVRFVGDSVAPGVLETQL